MQDSILTTIKKLLGLDDEYKVFDQDIIVFINSTFLQLKQLGVGPIDGFSINGEDEVWGDFLNDEETLKATQTYIYTRVRLLFDPPTTSFGQEALNKIAEEIGWRLYVETDPHTDNSKEKDS